MNDELSWDQRVREAGFVRGRHARRIGKPRNSSEWHESTGLVETMTDRMARAAWELGWDTENRRLMNQVYEHAG